MSVPAAVVKVHYFVVSLFGKNGIEGITPGMVIVSFAAVVVDHRNTVQNVHI
ncbi:hypothetical protein D3C80_1546380 [compost metagenome]